jgi:hypothetical protein
MKTSIHLPSYLVRVQDQITAPLAACIPNQIESEQPLIRALTRLVCPLPTPAFAKPGPPSVGLPDGAPEAHELKLTYLHRQSLRQHLSKSISSAVRRLASWGGHTQRERAYYVFAKPADRTLWLTRWRERWTSYDFLLAVLGFGEGVV